MKSTEIGTMNSPFIGNIKRMGSGIELPKSPFLKERKRSNRKFVKKTADGMTIYKIWHHDMFDSYDVLAKNRYGEWAYGRNYNLRTGRWSGATYRLNIDDLYERCPPYGKVIVNNKIGPTGRY